MSAIVLGLLGNFAWDSLKETYPAVAAGIWPLVIICVTVVAVTLLVTEGRTTGPTNEPKPSTQAEPETAEMIAARSRLAELETQDANERRAHTTQAIAKLAVVAGEMASDYENDTTLDEAKLPEKWAHVHSFEADVAQTLGEDQAAKAEFAAWLDPVKVDGMAPNLRLATYMRTKALTLNRIAMRYRMS